jgi:hypothetical protein
MKFREMLNESMLDTVKKDAEKLIKELPSDFEYEVSVNGITIKSGKSNRASIAYKHFKDGDKIQQAIELAYEREEMEPKKQVVKKLGNIDWEKHYDF